MDFDQERIYYTHQNLQQQNQQVSDDEDNIESSSNVNNEDNNKFDGDYDDVDLKVVRRYLREFLRNYQDEEGNYVYREQLLRNRRGWNDDYLDSHNLDVQAGGLDYCSIEVDFKHVGDYNSSLLGLLLSRPSDVLTEFELAARDALKSLIYENRDVDEGEVMDISPIQVLIRGNLASTPLRSITATHMNKLLLIPGIVISTSRIESRASKVAVQCSKCQHSLSLHPPGPFSNVAIPVKCQSQSTPEDGDCGINPYVISATECTFADEQKLKLQELPESVPTGEMPRRILLSCDRSLVDRCPPGARVAVFGIASIIHSKNNNTKAMYLRVVGMQKTATGDKNDDFTPAQEEAFTALSRRSDIYSIISTSIAPSISGSYTVDIKKALACMLMGGSRKALSDGMRLRGDINVLLIGDPSTAKSQFLKFISKVAPIAVYTSGKGSSAAGLTASVVRDNKGEFYLEAGAMVLADGGVVCIDEFDKMRSQDRVAIHEAMEQQTISVAKAGITTVLNSRTSVLAAANPVFGRYDDMKEAHENIHLMTTILSRFDLIFLVRDFREEVRDRAICKHVMGVHINGKHDVVPSEDQTDGAFTEYDDIDQGQSATSPESIAQNAMRVAQSGGNLDVATLNKYIQYCKAKCKPKLTEAAGDALTNAYVSIRDDLRKATLMNGGRQDSTVIPITVRQLEALVRLSESLAKMRLDKEVHAQDISEALRLFQVSTMNANKADQNRHDLSAKFGISTEDVTKVESYLRTRLPIGATYNKQRVLEEAVGRGFESITLDRALGVMVLRAEIQERNHGRLIKRIK